MAILQIKNMDDHLYVSLQDLARRNRRSVSQEVTSILLSYLSEARINQTNPTLEFLKLRGAWGDDRNADEIIREIEGSRTNSSRFGESNELFD